MPTKLQLAESARAYVVALTEALRERAEDDPALAPFVEALLACPMAACRTEPRARLDHPAMEGLALACGRLTARTAFARHVRVAADTLDWFPVFEGGGIDPGLAEGMLAAQAVGTYGCFAHESLAVGMFTILPGVHYPLHTHAATEIYFALAGAIEIRHGIDGTPFTLGAGEHSVTPPHRVHSVDCRAEPALIGYVWQGDLWCRNWWWARAPGGGWARTAWHRPAAGPWLPLETEPVDPAIMAEAHGHAV